MVSFVFQIMSVPEWSKSEAEPRETTWEALKSFQEEKGGVVRVNGGRIDWSRVVFGREARCGILL